MTRRNLELVLLCIAAPIVICLFAMIALNQGESLDLSTLGVPVGIFAAFIGAHIAERLFVPDADPAILPVTFALSGIGIAFVTRLAPDLAVTQLMWLFLSVGVMVVVLAVSRNMEKIARYKYTLMIFGFLLLLSPMIPGLGQEILGSRIWLHIGPLSFQPGEIAKIIIVLFLACYLAQNREMLSVFTWRIGPLRLPDIHTLMPLLIMWGIALVIVVGEKDLGSAMVFFFVFLVMLYVASGKKLYLVVGLGLITLGALGAYALFGHVQIRVNTWLDPFSDAQNTGYQLAQSIFSIADGGLFGTGIGRGMSSMIPVVESDFIFTCIAEETGLLGAAGVLLLFILFAVRGFLTAARAKSDLSSFASVGLTTLVVMQAFIIVGGVTRLIPLTGLTLPFISQGGSSLLASFIAVGLLLRCGDEGTGVSSEMTVTGTIGSEDVLGRIALGKRLTSSLFIFSVMFALLVANLTLIMVVQADYYKNMPANNHSLAKEAKTERGSISTYDDVVLARSVKQDDGTFKREYPAGTLASHVVGYASERFGTTGIESSMNDTLKGTSNFASWSDVIDNLSGATAAGNDVTLTINSEIQEAAQQALEGYTGACVVSDPKTGAILAMASSPTYDASEVETLLASSGKKGKSDEESQLVNRATMALYSPGSTFKIISLATALENNVAKETTVFDSPGVLEIDGGTVHNFNDENLGEITLAQATEYSSNTVFGQLGVKMGSKTLVEGAEKFGFDKDLDFDLPLYTSLMPDPKDMTKWETAWAAAGEPVGQVGPNATVLEMNMAGMAIANNGSIMKPYLVDGIYNAKGERSFAAQPSKLETAVSKSTAKRTRDVLVGVVENGTGTEAALDNVQVAGKTGTAENKNGDNSWFVGMAPADKPTVVVSIIIEHGKSGAGARQSHDVLQKALEVQGNLS